MNRSNVLNYSFPFYTILIYNIFSGFFYINIFDLFICVRDTEETLCIVGVICVQQYRSDTQKYWKFDCGLTEVPEDIPAQARRVYLNVNGITHIRNGAFRHLTNCMGLSLWDNRLTEVRARM